MEMGPTVTIVTEGEEEGCSISATLLAVVSIFTDSGIYICMHEFGPPPALLKMEYVACLL